MLLEVSNSVVLLVFNKFEFVNIIDLLWRQLSNTLPNTEMIWVVRNLQLSAQGNRSLQSVENSWLENVVTAKYKKIWSQLKRQVINVGILTCRPCFDVMWTCGWSGFLALYCRELVIYDKGFVEGKVPGAGRPENPYYYYRSPYYINMMCFEKNRLHYAYIQMTIDQGNVSMPKVPKILEYIGAWIVKFVTR